MEVAHQATFNKNLYKKEIKMSNNISEKQHIRSMATISYISLA